jgi:hypothetical protein
MTNPTSTSAPAVTLLDPGPYTSTETKTFRLSGPIDVTITTKYESSHVPPAPPPPSASSPDRDKRLVNTLIEALKPLAAQIFAKLDEIQNGQYDDSADPEEH